MPYLSQKVADDHKNLISCCLQTLAPIRLYSGHCDPLQDIYILNIKFFKSSPKDMYSISVLVLLLIPWLSCPVSFSLSLPKLIAVGHPNVPLSNRYNY